MYKKKSRIRETPTLSTDADSRTDTILERLRDLPIRTEKRTWSMQKCGLGPLLGEDSVHIKILTRFIPEHIPVLGLSSRSGLSSGTHPRF